MGNWRRLFTDVNRSCNTHTSPNKRKNKVFYHFIHQSTSDVRSNKIISGCDSQKSLDSFYSFAYSFAYMKIVMLCESNLYFEDLKVPVFEVSQPTPACPSDKSNIKVELSMDQWWNDTDRGNLEYSEEYLTQCHFAHHKLDQEVFWDWTWASAAKGWHIAKCRLWPHVEQSCNVQRGWPEHLLLCGKSLPFVIRSTWNTETHRVSIRQTYLMLKHTAHIVSTVF